MVRIAVIGGTGYAGSHIVQEAADRGHTVVSVARNPATHRVDGVTYLEGTIQDAPSLATALEGVEVVVVSVPARGDMLGRVRSGIADLVAALPPTVRIGVVGGAGGSLVQPGGGMLVDEPTFPEFIVPEAREAIGVLDDLRAGDRGHDWFYVHPAAEFGARSPGERTGSYRTGGDVLVTDAEGRSRLSGADLAVAIVDEIEQPAHTRERFTVGYGAD